MKTKIIQFDLETAKKIQAGEIEGKIKTRDGQNVQIVLWNKKDKDGFVILALIEQPRMVLIASYKLDGRIGYDEKLDLVLEVPDNEPQFKPFDKVLVRDISGQWSAAYYSHYNKEEDKHSCGGVLFDECIPYDEYLVGTTDNPK